MKKLFGLLMLVLLLSSGIRVSAQEMQPSYRFGIGAAAGFSTGYGLSFRYWPGNWGVQTTFAPYYDENGGVISFGLAGMRLIEDAGWIRFFAYAGQHFFFDSYSEYSAPDPDTYFMSVTGIGPGLEFVIKQRLGINVMFGMAFYYNNENTTMLNLTGETGIYYRF
ncbi:MAG: hypothetical protein ACOYXB_16040 [Bacteroidota bacterium]